MRKIRDQSTTHSHANIPIKNDVIQPTEQVCKSHNDGKPMNLQANFLTARAQILHETWEKIA